MFPLFNYEYTNHFIDQLEKIYLFLPFEKKTLGIIIRSLHIILPYVFLLLIFFKPNIFKPIVIFIIFLAILGFLLFGKCWVSLLEKKFCKERFNVMDPYLECFQLEKSNKNRINITILLTLFYFIIVIFIF
jgi:hypothetical protein